MTMKTNSKTDKAGFILAAALGFSLCAGLLIGLALDTRMTAHIAEVLK